MATAVDLEFADVNTAPVLAVQLHSHCAAGPAALGPAIRAAFGPLMNFISRHRLTPTGPPRVIYTNMGGDGISFILAMPVAAGLAEPVDDPSIRVETIEATRALRFRHQGPYENLRHTYSQITEFMKEKGWMKSPADWSRFMPMWEEYANDPEHTPPADLVTFIYLPVV